MAIVNPEASRGGAGIGTLLRSTREEQQEQLARAGRPKAAPSSPLRQLVRTTLLGQLPRGVAPVLRVRPEPEVVAPAAPARGEAAQAPVAPAAPAAPAIRPGTLPVRPSPAGPGVSAAPGGQVAMREQAGGGVRMQERPSGETAAQGKAGDRATRGTLAAKPGGEVAGKATFGGKPIDLSRFAGQKLSRPQPTRVGVSYAPGITQAIGEAISGAALRRGLKSAGRWLAPRLAALDAAIAARFPFLAMITPKGFNPSYTRGRKVRGI